MIQAAIFTALALVMLHSLADSVVAAIAYEVVRTCARRRGRRDTIRPEDFGT